MAQSPAATPRGPPPCSTDGPITATSSRPATPAGASRTAADKPLPRTPSRLIHVGAQAPPTPSAPRNAEGAALRARVPPMHYVGKPNPSLQGGRDSTRKGGRGWKRIDR